MRQERPKPRPAVCLSASSEESGKLPAESKRAELSLQDRRGITWCRLAGLQRCRDLYHSIAAMAVECHCRRGKYVDIYNRHLPVAL